MLELGEVEQLVHEQVEARRRIPAGGAVIVAVAGIEDTEAGAGGLPPNQAGRLSDERGNEGLQDAAAGGTSRERASQGVKTRAIHRKQSGA